MRRRNEEVHDGSGCCCARTWIERCDRIDGRSDAANAPTRSKKRRELDVGAGAAADTYCGPRRRYGWRRKQAASPGEPGQYLSVRKLATQDLYPLSQTPLRFLLSDHIDLQRDTNLVSVAADDVFVTLVVEDKQQFVGNNRLMLMFGAKDFQLRQWTVTDPQGYDTTVAVYNLDTKTKPDPDLFKINYDNPDLQNTR